MKTCRKCAESKALTEFYKHSMMADGHLNFCKSCVKERVRDGRAENPERVRARDRKRNQTAARKAWKLQFQRVIRERYPEKDRARAAVWRARLVGDLLPKPCEWCGNERSEAHHPDYSRPLDVMWLCGPCHREWHRRHAAIRDAQVPECLQPVRMRWVE